MIVTVEHMGIEFEAKVAKDSQGDPGCWAGERECIVIDELSPDPNDLGYTGEQLGELTTLIHDEAKGGVR